MSRIFLVLAGLCAVVIAVLRHDVHPGPGALLLGLLSIGLAVAAVPLPGFGAYSAAFGPALALALLPDGGPLLAAVIVGLGLAAGRRSSWSVELFCCLAALTGVAALHDPGARLVVSLVIYLPLAWRVPELAAEERLGSEVHVWTRQWEMTRLLTAAAALLGAATALLVPSGRAVWLLPAFPGLQLLARLNLRSLGREERAAFEQLEERSKVALQERHEELSEADRARQLEARERALLQSLTARLARAENLPAAVDVVLKVVGEEIPCQSVAVFLTEGDDLVPRGWKSPHAAALEGEELARQGEPLVTACWRTGKVATGSGERLFPGERSAAALPLRGQGVLYVGRDEPFLPEERPILTAIAGAAGLGLESARRFEGQRAALELHGRAHSKLKVWADRLAYLLEGVRTLNAGLSRQEVLERLRQLLEATLPHEAGAIVLEPTTAWPARFATPALADLARLVSANGKPLLVEDRAAFKGPDPGIGSFLAVPLGPGAIVLGSNSQTFTREQMDVLDLLAHQAEVALQNAALHLELRSTQARLVQSSKLAAVGQLAAGVAHELNTPLCAALVAVEMASLDEDLEVCDAHLAEAEEAGQRCREIIHKLLYYARQATDGETESDLNQVVRDTLELLGNQLTLDGVELSTDLCAQKLAVRADAKELQQVVTALLLNAREAVLGPGATSREIRLSTRAFEGFAGLQVADRGPGVDPSIRERIFDPFFTTRPVGKGAGLGLSVSRQILAAAGGTLDLADGPGATFRLQVPLARNA